MSTSPDPSPARVDRVREWRSPLLTCVAALLAFLTLSGLSAWLLPFGAFNQHLVLAHSLLGLAFIAPFAAYAWRHWRNYRRARTTHFHVTGWASLALVGVLAVTGVILTWQALLTTRISYAQDLVHVAATFALVAFVALHVVLVWWRDGSARAEALKETVAAQRRHRRRVAAWTLLPFAAVAIAWGLQPGYRWANRLPDDYELPFGPERPFAPSLARTVTGGAYDEMSLAGSERCGTSNCHEQITAEWSVSAHRWSALDTAFQGIQKVMGEQNGATSTRYCGGCHDPVSLFAGVKNLYAGDLTARAGYREGVSCLACHSIQETDVRGNADYVVSQPDRYLWELSDSRLGKLASDFLIRAYPRHHAQSLGKRITRTPEYCAACHKQFVDEEVNDVGWVQLQNQYDNWKNSRWNHEGEPGKTLECRECHMRLTDSTDPARGDSVDAIRSHDDGKHRNHRFIGSNQFMPQLLKLDGWEEQVRLTHEWLRGETEIPEIASRWESGPAVPIELKLPGSATPGEAIPVQVVLTSNKVGHDFPTGPLDIIQAWVEVTVTDASGREIFSSGRVDDANFVAPGAFMFKAEPVDQHGNLIDRHNLWEMVGVRFRRSLFPGFSDVAEYSVPCPGDVGATPLDDVHRVEVPVPADAGGTLSVHARLRYRKIDQFLLNFMFGETAGLTSPITDMSEASAQIPVRAPAAAGQ